MALILDLEKALKKGYKIPTGGMFRGEPCQIIDRKDDGKVVIRLVDNHIYAGQDFIVDDDCIIRTDTQ